MLPNFIVIGAAKCGTTSICDLLGKHHDIFMCSLKEPYYFCRKEDYESPEIQDWYKSLFVDAGSFTAVGEGSTAYTHPDVCKLTARRIANAIPGCKLIFMVRHPIKRLESDWKMRRREEWTPDSINTAIKEQPTLVTHGMYWSNLKEYVALFPDEQILVIFLEDFVTNPERELRRCFRFLCVDDSIIIKDAEKPRNKSSNIRKDGAVASMLRKIRIFCWMKDMLPENGRELIKSILMRKQEFEVEWDEGLKRKVIEQLKKDADIFLKRYGKPVDYWDLEN